MKHQKYLVFTLALLLSQPTSAMFKGKKGKMSLQEYYTATSTPVVPQDLKDAAATLPEPAQLPLDATQIINAPTEEESVTPSEQNTFSSPESVVHEETVESETTTSEIVATAEQESFVGEQSDAAIPAEQETIVAQESTVTMIATVEHEQYSDVEDEAPAVETKAHVTTRRGWSFWAPTAPALLARLAKDDAIQETEAFQLRRDIENAIDTLTKSIQPHNLNAQINTQTVIINPEIQTVMTKVDANAETIKTLEQLITESKRRGITLDQQVKANARGWIEKHDEMLTYLKDLAAQKTNALFSGEEKLNEAFDTRTPHRIATRLAYLKPERNTKQIKKARDLADWAILELTARIEEKLNTTHNVILAIEACENDVIDLTTLLKAIDNNYHRKNIVQVPEETHSKAFTTLETYRIKALEAIRTRTERNKDQQHQILDGLRIIARRKLTAEISEITPDSNAYVNDVALELENLK